MTADQLLTIREAMAVAHVSRRTIYNWIGVGKVRSRRTAGGRIRIDAASLFRTSPEHEEPVVHVGDRIRFSTALLAQIDKHPDHRSRLVKVDGIVHDPDGSTTLQLSMWRAH